MTNNNFFPFLHNSQKPLVEKNKSCRAINEKNCVCRFFVWRNFYVCLEKLLFIGLLKQINEKCMTNDDVWSCVWGWLGFCGVSKGFGSWIHSILDDFWCFLAFVKVLGAELFQFLLVFYVFWFLWGFWQLNSLNF